MKERLRCKLFGHDFRGKLEDRKYIYRIITDNCRNCGLTKKEVMEMKK